jgi:PAS domain S-box-containing protein
MKYFLNLLLNSQFYLNGCGDSYFDWGIICIVGSIIFALFIIVILRRSHSLMQLNGQLIKEIKELKKTEKTLQKNQQKIRAIFNQTFQFIGLLDLDGIVIEVNETALNIVGFEREDIIGKPFWETPWWSHYPKYKTQLQEGIKKASQDQIVRFETTHFDKNNRLVYVDFSLKPVKDETGKVIFLIPEGRDITEIKKYQEALEEKQQELEAIFEIFPDLFFRLDSEGIILEYRGASTSDLYVKPEFFLGKPMLEILPDRVAQDWEKGMSQVLKSKSLVCLEYTLPMSTGEEYYEARLLPFSNQQIIIIVRNISQRKQAERELEASENKLQALLNHSSDIVSIFDRQGALIYNSPVAEQIYGFSPQEMREQRTFDLIHPDDRIRVGKTFSKLLEDPQNTITVQYQYQTKAGEYIWMETVASNQLDNPNIQGIVANSRDITRRKQAEQEIRGLNEALAEQNLQLEQRVAQRTAELEMLFNTLPDFIFVVERYTMKLYFCNQVFAQGIGFDNRSEVEGKTIFECFPPEMANYFAQQNEQVFNSGETLHLEETISLPEGDRYFDTYKVPLKTPQGDIYALLGTSRDITELVKTKQVLIERTTQLEFINQELDSFCYSVSHDLRAPLRHIHGFVNALKQRLAGSDALQDPKVLHYLEVIENSSKKMGHLIDGLLTLSRVGRHELVCCSVNLNSVVKTAISLVSSADNKIEFQVGKLPTVQGEAALLQQVFVNLLENGIKFSRERNPIKIQIDSLEDGTIFVSDNGVGFDMEYADKLFGAFQRLHSQKDFEGTGIGLSIVQRIIHRHGGRIWAESVPENGATFYFKIGETC